MKQKKGVILGGILMAISLGLLMLGVRDEISGSAQPRKKRLPDPAMEVLKAQLQGIEGLAKQEPRAADAEFKRLLEKLPEKYQAYHDLGVEAAVGPVHLYGKVVDQAGAPVVGALVGYSVNGRFYAPGIRQAYTRTDEDGRFEIHEQGANIELNGILHPEIDFQFPQDSGGGRIGGKVMNMTFYDAPPVRGRKVPLLSDTSEGNPYVFRAWRVDKFADAKEGHYPAYLRTDGRIYTIDFNAQMRHRLKRGAVDGHIRISCARAPMKDYSERVSWKVTISPVNGGIQSTEDLYMNVAPEAGYQPSVTLEREKGSPSYQKSLENNRFFFKANNGQAYGSLIIDIEPHAKLDKCQVDILKFKVNGDGSRNLAVKPGW